MNSPSIYGGILMLLFLIFFIFGCDTDEMEGVCIYNDSICTDERSKLGCNNKDGDFTHGKIGDAINLCDEKGFNHLCGEGKEENSTIWVKTEADCEKLEE